MGIQCVSVSAVEVKPEQLFSLKGSDQRGWLGDVTVGEQSTDLQEP